jgi:hydrogenase/urease accessory protein HupE
MLMYVSYEYMWRLGFFLLLLGLLSLPVAAHPLDVTFSILTLQDARVTLETGITARQVGVMFLNKENDFSIQDIVANEQRILAHYNENIRWQQGEKLCPLTQQVLTYNREDISRLLLDGLLVKSEYLCPGSGGELEFTHSLFTHNFPDQRNILVLEGDVMRTNHVLTPETTRATIDLSSHTVRLTMAHPVPQGLVANLLQFVRLGIEHVAIGYDHILFMVGIYLVVRKPRQLLTVITSFTVAHSITLVLATLEIVQVPSRFVEAAIAATIVYVGIENILKKDFSHRPAITFGLGLIHGLGFSSVLRQIGIPREFLIPDLLAFNVGVELGQLAIVVALLPVIWLLSRNKKVDKIAVPAISLVIIVIGTLWFFERI